VHAILAQNRHRRASHTRAAAPTLLKGLIFGPDDRLMAPSHTRRRGRLYRFYRTATSLKLCHGECPIRAVPAGEVEAAVINQVRALLRAPEVIIRTWRAAWLNDEQIDERDVVEALQRLDPLWDQLFPVEQARILQLWWRAWWSGWTTWRSACAVRASAARGRGAAGGMTKVRLSADGSTVTMFVPMAWRRRGGRKSSWRRRF
jgi:hypothetical protein